MTWSGPETLSFRDRDRGKLLPVHHQVVEGAAQVGLELAGEGRLDVPQPLASAAVKEHEVSAGEPVGLAAQGPALPRGRHAKGLRVPRGGCRRGRLVARVPQLLDEAASPRDGGAV